MLIHLTNVSLPTISLYNALTYALGREICKWNHKLSFLFHVEKKSWVALFRPLLNLLNVFFFFLICLLFEKEHERGTIFALSCLFNACYSIYALSWVGPLYLFVGTLTLNTCVQDLLMDWSILGLHSKYPFLRPELLYSNHIFVGVHVSQPSPLYNKSPSRYITLPL